MQKLFIALVSIALIAGCGGKKNTKPDMPEGPATTTGMDKPQTNGATSSGSDINGGQSGQPIDDGNTAGAGVVDGFDDPASPLSKNIIYFDYNSSQISDIDIVNAHGNYLASSPGAKIRLEGHADERGSREFNIALSERRAQEVRRLMMFQGAKASQMEVVALGEERPVKFGHAETSWQENRRVEIVYETK
ncbi:MAG TPA: peptidoglycan-associated lipoprotein [Gammaproteobacteria bacterium]|jgi:peptidoglycan-associated lipoprotein|nr:peptidoglycan-associated lipoprotein [Gammaproteobacteria bacterium]